MEFSTGIDQYNINYNLNAIGDYNKFLHDNSSFIIEKEHPTEFETALEEASKNYYVKDKHDPAGIGNFASQMGQAFSNSLNAVNNTKLEADRLQEDLAMGGSTNVHDAMIAAEKASLSMQMAIQVRNRLISAYTDITGMMI